MTRRICFFLFLIVAVEFGYAQLNSDSILQSFRTKFTDDSVRLNELSNLIEVLDNPHDWKVLNDSLLVQSRQRAAIKNLKHRSSFQYLYANSLNNLALFMRQSGKTDSALYFYQIAATEMSKTTRHDQLGSVYNNIAFVHSKKGDYKTALDYYFKALKIFTDLKMDKDISHVKNNIGFIYYEQDELGLAYKYFWESAETMKKLGDKKTYCSAVINYSGILNKQGKVEEARKNIKDIISLSIELNDERLQSYICFNLASIWFSTSLDSALKYYKESLQLRQKTHNQPGIISCEARIGNLYRMMGRKQEAEKLLLHSFNSAVQTGYVSEQRESAKSLWQLYKDKGDARNSLKYYEHYILINDSMQQQQSKKDGMRKMFQYEFEKKIAADSVKYVEQKKITEARLIAQKAEFEHEKFQKYAVLIGILAVLGGLILVFNRFRITNKQKKIIEQQKVLVDNAYHSLAEKNKEVMDSIRYAKRIQSALVTSESYIERNLNLLTQKKARRDS